MASTLNWPAIPGIVGEEIFNIGGVGITTTVFSTWLFMVVLFVVVAIFYSALKNPKNTRTKAFGLSVVEKLDHFATENVGNKKNARLYFPLIAGFFILIFVGNIFGLILDWFGLVSPVMHHYVRPFNSDMSTTVALAAAAIIVTHIAGMKAKGMVSHWEHYLFAWHGNSLIEKIINVPVGWIHLLGELARVLSLSVRLFANIFAGVALIMVMKYLGSMIPVSGIGEIFVLPIWFFEILVAGIQAFVFALLVSIYIKESTTTHH